MNDNKAQIDALLSDLNYIKRQVKELQDREKKVVEQLKNHLQESGEKALQNSWYKVGFVPHSYVLVHEGTTAQEREAKEKLLEKLLKQKNLELLDISLNTKRIAELAGEQHLDTENLLRKFGLRVEQRERFEFSRL